MRMFLAVFIQGRDRYHIGLTAGSAGALLITNLPNGRLLGNEPLRPAMAKSVCLIELAIRTKIANLANAERIALFCTGGRSRYRPVAISVGNGLGGSVHIGIRTGGAGVGGVARVHAGGCGDGCYIAVVQRGGVVFLVGIATGTGTQGVALLGAGGRYAGIYITMVVGQLGDGLLLLVIAGSAGADLLIFCAYLFIAVLYQAISYHGLWVAKNNTPLMHVAESTALQECYR